MKYIKYVFIIVLLLIFLIYSNIYSSNFKKEVSNYLNEEYNLNKEKMKIESVYSPLEYKLMSFQTSSLPEKAIVYYEELIIDVEKYKDNEWSDNYLKVKELDDKRADLENLISPYSVDCYVLPSSSHGSYILYINCEDNNNIDKLISSVDNYIVDEEEFLGYSIYVFNNDNLISDLKNKAKSSLDGLADKYKELEFDDFSSLNNENIIYRIGRNHTNQKQFEKFEI